MRIDIQTPIPEELVQKLRVGATVNLSGVVVTGRDAAHQWLVDRFVSNAYKLDVDDKAVFTALERYLDHGVIYHCGPVVTKDESGVYHITAAGPTTSLRMEPYQEQVMQMFNLRGVIGKGGMGAKTLKACAEQPAVYFHAIGGAAALIAATVREVIGVYKLEFGMPEAMWVLRVKDLPLVVTMDSHSNSLNDQVKEASSRRLVELLGEGGIFIDR